MKWKRPVSLLMVLVAAAFFAVACGDDDNKDDKKSSDDSTMSDDSSKDDDAMEDDAMSGDKEPVDVGGAPMYPDKTVVENASTAPNLTNVVAAIKAAGLVETLSGPGPFTVFAPDDTAFGKVDKAALANLLKPAQKEALTGILTYHVVPGTLDASKLKDGDKLTTVNGAILEVKVEGDTVMVGNADGMATVTQADVFQSNGVAHIIDTVMMPPAA